MAVFLFPHFFEEIVWCGEGLVWCGEFVIGLVKSYSGLLSPFPSPHTQVCLLPPALRLMAESLGLAIRLGSDMSLQNQELCESLLHLP